MTKTENLLAVTLENRSILKVAGSDARPFLQGIVSNDIDKVSATRAIWAALLTPQGKYLYDFFVCQVGDTLLLDCERSRRDELAKRLRRFKLRSDVAVEAIDDLTVVALFPPDAAPDLAGWSAGTAENLGGGSLYIDPRLRGAGARAMLPTGDVVALLDRYSASVGSMVDYDRFRIGLGLPDSSRDITVEKTVLLEAGFDELNGVDWQKGCYMGQEVTARTYHRGLVKRRLIPLEIDGPAPEPGIAVLADDKEVGELMSVEGTAA